MQNCKVKAGITKQNQIVCKKAGGGSIDLTWAARGFVEFVNLM